MAKVLGFHPRIPWILNKPDGCLDEETLEVKEYIVIEIE
jgi:hypothetical protein